MAWAARVSAPRVGFYGWPSRSILERTCCGDSSPSDICWRATGRTTRCLFVAYVYGFVLAGNAVARPRDRREWPRALLTASISTVARRLVHGSVLEVRSDPPPYLPELLGVLDALRDRRVGMDGRRFSARPAVGSTETARSSATAAEQVTRSTSSHQPIIVAVAYVVVQTSASVASKFTTIFVISALATFFSAGFSRASRLPPFGVPGTNRREPSSRSVFSPSSVPRQRREPGAHEPRGQRRSPHPKYGRVPRQLRASVTNGEASRSPDSPSRAMPCMTVS